jgi:hypothetical protein
MKSRDSRILPVQSLDIVQDELKTLHDTDGLRVAQNR